jgi:signal transduction histidine kinase
MQVWQRLDARVVDVAIALGLTVLTQIQVGGPAGAGGRGALLLTLALAFRRRWPLAVAALAGIGAALQGLAASPPSSFGEYVSITLAIYTVADREDLVRAMLGGVFVVAGIVLHDVHSPDYGSASGMASDLTVPVVFWAVGRAVRVARDRLLEDRRRAGEAVESERRHIARELHDIVTHSLGVVVLQAQGARLHLDGREPTVTEALDAIERSGRTALAEMRRLLGLLRDTDSPAELTPAPRLAQLASLAREVSAAGLPVELAIEGEPFALEAGVDLSGYRIVQEALTNALRHSGASGASVRVRYARRVVELEIVDDGRGPNGAAAGRGLLGMRERVAFYGGRLEHGATGGRGGYRVRAWLPSEPSR